MFLSGQNFARLLPLLCILISQIGDFPSIIKEASAFVVPNQGLFIYGGSPSVKAMKLSSLASNWSLDFANYLSLPIEQICIVQVGYSDFKICIDSLHSSYCFEL